jgi:hypothetical protein
MASSDRPEKRGTATTYPRGDNFAKLLIWHLNFGTRPAGGPDQPGKRWSNKEFAAELGIGERTVRYWRNGDKRPTDFPSLERVLFGDNAAYAEWRFDLRAAYDDLRPPIIDGEIPSPPADFLGREADVTAILDVLLSSAPARAILIQGAPGIGKTALTKLSPAMNVSSNGSVTLPAGSSNSKPPPRPPSCRVPSPAPLAPIHSAASRRF